MMRGASRALPLHLQLAGPAARPKGHPDHAFVTPRLAVGEYPTPEDARWLRSGIAVDVVISLQDDVDLQRKGIDPQIMHSALGAEGIVWHRHPVGDGDTVAMGRELDAIVATMHAHLGVGERVYVHCNAGINRAPTAVIAFLRVHSGLSLDAACRVLKAVRPCVPYLRLLRARYSG